jgi:hypothetical protein
MVKKFGILEGLMVIGDPLYWNTMEAEAVEEVDCAAAAG